MTLEELRNEHKDWILMEAIVGSQSFGLATLTSDIDCRGIFVLPMSERIKADPIKQIADEKNNEVYWELSFFLQLIGKSNPSALEFLFSPEHCIRIGKKYFDFIKSMPINFVNMQCKNSFLNYATGQLGRARGLNKKVTKPCPKEPPQVLDYCYILKDNQAIKIKDWLETRENKNQKWYALAAIDHMDMGYAVYEETDMNEHPEQDEHLWRWAYGIVADEIKSNDIQLNSIPKNLTPVAFMMFNRNHYSKDCKEHTEYWKWVSIRNEERYKNTVEQGNGYDAKNAMHCIRLLMTAKDIAEKHILTVDRTPDREYLLSIKHGVFSYEEVMAKTNDLYNEAAKLFDESDLPAIAYENITPDDVLVKILNLLPAVFWSL